MLVALSSETENFLKSTEEMAQRLQAEEIENTLRDIFLQGN